MTRGQRIKAKREERGMSQSELAHRLGISKQSQYKYENDIITNIPSDVIEHTADILDCSPSYLMGWTPEAEAVITRIKDRITDVNKSKDERKQSLWERIKNNDDLLSHVEKLYYLPPDRQDFIYTTIRAQYNEFNSGESQTSDA